MSHICQRALDALKAHARLEEPDDVEIFDDALAICGEHIRDFTPGALAELMRVFRDDVAEIEVMYGLVHVVEDAPLQPYVEALLSVLPTSYHNAPEWMMRLVRRTVNEPIAAAELSKQVKNAPSDVRQIATEILRQIGSPRAIAVMRAAGLD